MRVFLRGREGVRSIYYKVTLIKIGYSMRCILTYSCHNIKKPKHTQKLFTEFF